MAWVNPCWFVERFILLGSFFHLITINSNLLNQDFFLPNVLLNLGLKLSILPMEVGNHGLELAVLGFDFVIRVTFLDLMARQLVVE
jgi:hypothetical protein